MVYADDWAQRRGGCLLYPSEHSLRGVMGTMAGRGTYDGNCP